MRETAKKGSNKVNMVDVFHKRRVNIEYLNMLKSPLDWD
jgi:hypothetical protein